MERTNLQESFWAIKSEIVDVHVNLQRQLNCLSVYSDSELMSREESYICHVAMAFNILAPCALRAMFSLADSGFILLIVGLVTLH